MSTLNPPLTMCSHTNSRHLADSRAFYYRKLKEFLEVLKEQEREEMIFLTSDMTDMLTHGDISIGSVLIHLTTSGVSHPEGINKCVPAGVKAMEAELSYRLYASHTEALRRTF